MLSALDLDAPQVLVGGKTYRRVLRSVGSYYTMAGPVSIERTLYRVAGKRNAETVDAVSLRAEWWAMAGCRRRRRRWRGSVSGLRRARRKRRAKGGSGCHTALRV